VTGGNFVKKLQEVEKQRRFFAQLVVPATRLSNNSPEALRNKRKEESSVAQFTVADVRAVPPLLYLHSDGNAVAY
jgi:hypothetical protein